MFFVSKKNTFDLEVKRKNMGQFILGQAHAAHMVLFS